MKYILVTILFFLLTGASPDDARKANEAYHNGNYEEAISLYRKAIEDNPKNAKLYFNLANALARAGRSEEAIRNYERFKSMTEKPELRARANYNIGKVYSNNKQWDRAAAFFKESLRYMAADADAKHNYELAKQKKNKKNSGQQQQNPNNRENPQQQQTQNRQQQQNQQNPRNQQNQQDRQQQRQQQQRQGQKMSKAEAAKILKALEQKEKELLKQFKKRNVESTQNTNAKDW